ncbi:MULTISPECIES: DUF6164 family protein [Halomonadaceae]|jgi:hypothetical protein|uniref:DUF6164 family protein n=1 Tax=Halomonadaceae TaxID=28256 RepID=UPI0015840F11|nr:MULTISPECIES: DUF6164 family protein [Halomonas]MDI4636867.1 DUF6164 family protein [Halomonas sp. BMC7]NUJ58035.1 hypothetical protein [Halomonas taeanensis]|tara:strand:- start:7177 stop:7539 length:363 start_codon:yes stop_codon:yes gene_type:complete
MAALLFHLRDVPEEEAQEVRELLAEHDLEIYETEAGRWKLSVPALWLVDESRLEEARSLIDAYQQSLYERVHREYAEAHDRGETPGVWDRLRQHPAAVLVTLIALGLLLGLSLLPFFLTF